MVECFIFNRNGDFLFNFALNSHCLFQSLPLPPPHPPQKRKGNKSCSKYFYFMKMESVTKKENPVMGCFPRNLLEAAISKRSLK